MARWSSREKGLIVSLHSLSHIFTQFLLLLSLLSAFCSLQIAICDSAAVVNSLPGFEGPLPFELETGYIGVGDLEDAQLFYYFVKSESNPEEDPLILWITGGPCCSSFSALLYEIGPLVFETPKRDGSLPTLALNPYSWSKVASIIFLDLPIGTGFSYSETAGASSDDIQSCDQTYRFLRKWLTGHPEFLSNTFYVGGDSYSGIGVPIITQLILNGNEAGMEPPINLKEILPAGYPYLSGNEAGMEPPINLKGYVLGNPRTNPDFERNYEVPYAHGVALISDELYESLQRSCKGEYTNIDPSNTQCLLYHEAYTKCTKGLNRYHILDPSCGVASPRPQNYFSERRFLDERNTALLAPDSSLCESSQVNLFRLSYTWLNDDNVREALHIRRGSIGAWSRCDCGLPYYITITSSFDYHVNLSTKGLRSLVYSGDHDLVNTHLGTQAWIRSLNYSIVDDWRPWTVQGQVSGYTRSYSNGMTFATVKGGGHIAQESKPLECFSIFSKWIDNQPL